MNTQEKSLKLAGLMGWELRERKIMQHLCYVFVSDKVFQDSFLEPYDWDKNGLAQAHSILLKFPEVMGRFFYGEDIRPCWYHPATGKKPKQADLLDEILRMNGVEV